MAPTAVDEAAAAGNLYSSSSSFEDFAFIQSSSAIFLTTPLGSSSSVEVRR